MKVCLFLEGAEFLAPSGFPGAFRNHFAALGRAGIEATTDPNEPHDVLHVEWFGPRSVRQILRARRRGVKVVVHAHSIGAFDLHHSWTFSTQIAPFYEMYLHWVYRRADCLFTPGPRAKDMLRAKGFERVAVVSNGVDRERFQYRPEAREENRRRLGLERFAVYAAGNLFPRKGVVDFLEVAERVPEVDFIWYGQRWSRVVSFAPRMQSRIDRRPGNVFLPGFVRDTAGAFSAADALFFPSLGENQPMVVLEAASLRRPLLLRDLPEYDRWMRKGDEYLAADSVDGFVREIRRLASDAGERERLAAAADALAEAHRLDLVGQRLRTLYEAVLDDRDVD